MSDTSLAEHHQRTPLEERLIALIQDNGPISIADFMADALGHQQFGYYMSQDPFGAEGDFTTAPEISQIFGELIGAWLVDAWQTMGAPSLFNLIELGPGRGTLMADIIRVGNLRPDFIKAARIAMVENSGRLRVRQQRHLSDYSDQISWYDGLEGVPAAPTLVVANEFFDCLPIRQFVRTADKTDTPWRERLVGVTDQSAKAQLCYALSEEQFARRPNMPAADKPEALFEECSAATPIIEALAERFSAHKGRALIIDYGHGRPGFGDTFQAVKRHDIWHPLAQPGMADITAHVDFSALARTGRNAQMRVDGPVRQADFLSRLGLGARLEALCKAAENTDKSTDNDTDKSANLRSGALRLIASEGMGSLFKVLSISSKDLPQPPGFE